jgi:acetyltransferase-like isoleucine patch superfamily enzyme
VSTPAPASLALPVPALSRAWSATSPGPRPSVSVIILTLNEEINVAECLASCGWSDDVHVLDSGSTDATRDLAAHHGAGVHVNPFVSFGAQRNWALDNIPLRHDWVFHLDADERFTPELVAEIAALLDHAPTEDGFYVPNKLMFMGRWLRRSGGYPTYQMRLFHKARMRFIDHGHGQREREGSRLGTLRQPYLHYAFSKGLYDWIDKHNRYSSLEALQVQTDARSWPTLSALRSPNVVARRRAWKQLSYMLPFRAHLRYLSTMFVLGAAWEGRPGRTYARLLSMYERMIDLKLALVRSNSYQTVFHDRFERDQRPVTPVATVPAAPTSPFQAGDRPTQAPSRQGLPAAPPELTADEGQLLPEASPWTLREKIARAFWMLLGRPVFRASFHNWYEFRSWWLRLFGARIGNGVRLRPTAHVEIPWNVDIRDGATVGDHAIVYSLGRITIGERTIVSQYAHLCAGTHDFTDRRFPLIRDPIWIGSDAWIGADAFVGPNVRIGHLAVLGARSSTYKDLEPKKVYVGNPAKALKERELH